MSILAKRLQKIDSSGIRKVFELAATVENPINFSIGQPDFPVPSEVRKDIIAAVEANDMRYTLTQGNESLRRAILKDKYNDKYLLNSILITSGVSGGIVLLYMSLLDKDDEVMIFDPYFVMYEQLLHLCDAKANLVDTYPDFKITKERLENAYTPKTKIMMVNSPCNPTGYVYSESEIKIIAEFAKEKNILVVSDEIYRDFCYDSEYVSIADYYDNVIILDGFSKNLALTGERIGYAIGPSDIIAEMIKLQQYTFVCAPASVQRGIENHIKYDFTSIRDVYKKKRDMVYEALYKHCDFVKSGGAFYAFPMLKSGITATDFCAKAIANRVLIIPGNVFSQKDCSFRISFAVDDNKLKEGLDILSNILQNT